MSDETYYTFVQDESAHWYMIPVSKVQLFYELSEKADELDQKAWRDGYEDEELEEAATEAHREFEETFDEYRGEYPQHIKFQNPERR